MEIKEPIKAFIITNLLIDNPAVTIESDTQLMSSGLINSISTLELVDFIETTFSIEFDAYEVTKDNLETLNIIEKFINTKKQ